MLSLDHVTVRMAGRTLLDTVSLDVVPGQVTAVVGANGAGKTTLLRSLSGEWIPTNGAVRLDGHPLGDLASQQLARRRAVMPQQSTLTFGFTVLEVVLLGRTPHGTTRAFDSRIAFEAMEETGVAHLASRSYPTLSGGEQQRVHLARVLSQIWKQDTPDNTRFLLLDEPTSNLDLAYQHNVLRTAQRCARNGIGVLTVLHDLNLASQYADRIAVLHRGRLLVTGSPEAVLTPDLILKAFDIPVMVTEHPCASCPLVVPLPFSVAHVATNGRVPHSDTLAIRS